MVPLAVTVGKYEFLADKICYKAKIWKKQTGIVNDQYKLFKDQINVVNSERGDGIKTESGEKIVDEHHKYTGSESTNLIVNILAMEKWMLI